jgi:hypothetical protein
MMGSEGFRIALEALADQLTFGEPAFDTELRPTVTINYFDFGTLTILRVALGLHRVPFSCAIVI